MTSGARAILALMAAFLFRAASVSGAATTQEVALRARQATDSGGVKAGKLAGHAYLGNPFVVFVWATPEEGAGLVSMYDKVSGRELLKAKAADATVWRIEMKKGAAEETVTRTNAGRACTVTCRVVGEEGRVWFKWAGDVKVEVATRLRADESVARSQITVQTSRRDEGLLAVTFPVVEGIVPFTEGAKGDEILQPFKLGWTKPSPLASEEKVDVAYPGRASLQMTAALGDGRGLYIATEDAHSNRKKFTWERDGSLESLVFSLSHPVLNWGAEEPVRSYESPGDVVMGPFEGDWFDAARIYRKWALTAPWSAKGPFHTRQDYARWLARVPYWSTSGLSAEEGIDGAIERQEFMKLPEMVLHDYWYSMNRYQHDRNPEYFPPRIGSRNYKRVIKEFKERGVRVIPYVIGWLWNMTTESYREEDAERKGAMRGPEGGLYWTWAGGLDPQAAMCPATDIWRNKMVEVSRELVGTYDLDGVYFDYFTIHCSDCFVEEHGHPIAGGNYWTQGVHGLYERVRRELKAVNPDAMMCGEDAAEWVIDVLDACYQGGPDANAPVFLAVYHGYHQVFGGTHNRDRAPYLGRWWLMGCTNGRTNQVNQFANPTNERMRTVGPWFRDLIRCHREFALPYLGHGEMLRPVTISGEFPTMTLRGDYGPFELPSVQGTAWRAEDGSVGIFILNYDREEGFEITWRHNLSEIAGITADTKVKATRWTALDGERTAGRWTGGLIERTTQIKPLELIALKLEAIR